MTKHEEALAILLNLRRRLVDRLTDAVLGRKQGSVENPSDDRQAMTTEAAVGETAATLAQLETAIAALQSTIAENNGRHHAATPPSNGPAEQASRIFDRFTEFVSQTRLENAARELAQVFQMSLDRMTTATRFYARAVKTDPSIIGLLGQLPAVIERASAAQCMKAMVRVFGFQAVESNAAAQSLRARLQQVSAPPAPVHSAQLTTSTQVRVPKTP